MGFSLLAHVWRHASLKSRDSCKPGPFCGNSVNRKAGGREWRVVCSHYLGNILKLLNQPYLLFRIFKLIASGIIRVHTEIRDSSSILCPKQKAAWNSSGKSRANSTRPVQQRWAALFPSYPTCCPHLVHSI